MLIAPAKLALVDKLSRRLRRDDRRSRCPAGFEVGVGLDDIGQLVALVDLDLGRAFLDHGEDCCPRSPDYVGSCSGTGYEPLR